MLKWLKKSQAGQAMVEMALVLPILLVLVGGIIDFGWLYYNKIALNNAAREGARYAAIHHTTAADWQQAVVIMTSTYVGSTPAGVAKVEDAGNSQVKATITADVRILTGVASTVMGQDSVTMTGTCIMRLEN